MKALELFQFIKVKNIHKKRIKYKIFMPLARFGTAIIQTLNESCRAGVDLTDLSAAMR